MSRARSLPRSGPHRPAEPPQRPLRPFALGIAEVGSTGRGFTTLTLDLTDGQGLPSFVPEPRGFLLLAASALFFAIGLRRR